MWFALWEVTSVLYICPFFHRLYFGGYSILLIARSIDTAPLPSDNKSTMGPGLAVVGTPAPHRMLHEQRFFFLALWAIVFALSCVYGRSLFNCWLTNAISTTFGGAAGDTFVFRVHLHAVPESCLLFPGGTVMGIEPIGLTCRARLPLGCAPTQGVVGSDLQLERGALLFELCRLSYVPWWCRWATWQ